MNMYLFTDGTNRVQEAQSNEELLSLINSASDQNRARVWVYNSNEWITCSSFLKNHPEFRADSTTQTITDNPDRVKRGRYFHGIRRAAFIALVITGALLVFNFTNTKWEKTPPFYTTATRPPNVPVMNIDSLISEIELARGKLLDKNTRQNLRMRNNWPDNIQLKLNAERQVKGNLSQYYNLLLKLDNASGFMLDEVQVGLFTWKKGKASLADTIQFSNIRYDKIMAKELTGSFRCDSISVSFLSIRASNFNFCYSADVKNNSGNYNDRWFCREGKQNE